MGHWNYRVIKEVDADSGDVTLSIREYYYGLSLWSAVPDGVIANDIEGLRWQLDMMAKALEKPIITSKEAAINLWYEIGRLESENARLRQLIEFRLDSPELVEVAARAIRDWEHEGRQEGASDIGRRSPREDDKARIKAALSAIKGHLQGEGEVEEEEGGGD